MGADNATGTQAMGYDDDVLVRRPEGWEIAQRLSTLVCVRSALPSTGG